MFNELHIFIDYSHIVTLINNYKAADNNITKGQILLIIEELLKHEIISKEAKGELIKLITPKTTLGEYMIKKFDILDN